MKRLIAAACLTMMVAAPAAAHSEHDLIEWRDAWQLRVETRGLSVGLVSEWVDMHRRHPCNATLGTPCAPAPEPVTASRSTGSTGSVSSNVNRSHGGDVEQWRPIVEQYFGANTNAALSVMACESGGNPNAKNTRSSASGLFQFLSSTWTRVTGEQYPGNVFDGPSNIAAAAKLSNGGTNWREWSCKP